MKESALDARIDELESRQAFQDDTIAALNDALVMQQQRISHLEKTLRHVIERLGGEGTELELPGEEPPPPHY